jgi:hypothetical protein
MKHRSIVRDLLLCSKSFRGQALGAQGCPRGAAPSWRPQEAVGRRGKDSGRYGDGLGGHAQLDEPDQLLLGTPRPVMMHEQWY